MMFAIKRVLRDASFLISLAVLLVISILSIKAGEDIQTPPFGFTCVAEGREGDNIRSRMQDAGFVKYDSEKELKEAIGDGYIDCAVLFDEDITKKLESGNLDGSIKLITSPATILPELCRAQTVSVLSMLYSPYVTYEALDEAVSLDEVKETYYEMTDSGDLFKFDIKSTEGKIIPKSVRSRGLFTGCIAIMIFIVAFIGICRPAHSHMMFMRTRVGTSMSITSVMIPELIVRVIILILVSAAACVVTSHTGMVPAVAVYTLAVTCIGIVLTAILPDTWMIIITVITTVLALGLCPVFTDLAEMIPAVATIRKFLIPYLMWVFEAIL